MAAASTTSAIDPELLGRFSSSIRDSVIPDLPAVDLSLGRLAGALLEVHPEYCGDADRSIPETYGEERSLEQWLRLIAGLFDEGALRDSSSEVVDVRLALLSLGRLNRTFNGLLEQRGIRRRYERDVGFDPAAVMLPWARPGPRTYMVQLWKFEQAEPLVHCALSPDGRLLVAGGQQGTVLVWDLVTDESVTLRGHEQRVLSCSFAPDNVTVATASADGTARLWDVAPPLTASRDRLLATFSHDQGEVRRCPFSPDGRYVATAGEDGTARLWDVRTRSRAAGNLMEHRAPIAHCAFRPDGRLLATAGSDGSVRLWDVPSGETHPPLDVRTAVQHCVFDRTGRLLAAVGVDGTVRLFDLATSEERPEVGRHAGPVWRCAFGPDGRLLVTVGLDGAKSWDVALGGLRTDLGDQGEMLNCAFSADGRVVATAGTDGSVRVWDAASGEQRGAFPLGSDAVPACVFSADGTMLAAVTSDGVAAVWEQLAPSLLPAVSPDSVDRRDLLDVGMDATALANVIAAEATKPPVSIGLFGDWGSGKTFLIGQIQDRVQRLAVRARRSNASSSPYCRYVRNIAFNAWQYADANLWASLVTHIFEALARPEPSAGVTTDEDARRQLARLEEELAARSAVQERLRRAHFHARRLRALRKLAFWTLGASEAVDARVGGVAAGVRQLLGQGRVRAVVGGTALAVGAGVGTWLGVDFLNPVESAIAAAAAALTPIGLWAGRVGGLLSKAGDTARLADSNRASLAAELDAADTQVRELQAELGDLASGRRLARFAAERGASDDYRAQLGLVSRIHADFVRMAEILEAQAAAARTTGASPSVNPPAEAPAVESAGLWGRFKRELKRIRPLRAQHTKAPLPSAQKTTTGASSASDLPVIDRIVLYIDDLDRCPPKRVVEVLEAVHLILALPLFVVVIAVDPRWLLQSLKLHYSDLLAAESGLDGTRVVTNGRAVNRRTSAVRAAEAENDAWRSTPLNYLDKIIQVPFALRPMGSSGAAALVHGLLPVEADDEPLASGAVEAFTPSGQAGTGTHDARRHETGSRLPQTSAAPELSPRILSLTDRERAFAVVVASDLRTPRAVKKFTNLYRLVRARLDERELDRFLDEEGEDIAEYQAVLMLLGVLIAFPEEAVRFLDNIGELGPSARRDTSLWSEYMATLDDADLRSMVERMCAATGRPNSTREPFRAWRSRSRGTRSQPARRCSRATTRASSPYPARRPLPRRQPRKPSRPAAPRARATIRPSPS
jgi:WD40 repeat protein